MTAHYLAYKQESHQGWTYRSMIKVTEENGTFSVTEVTDTDCVVLGSFGNLNNAIDFAAKHS